ncbi:MAG: hypothetical protein K2Y16_09630 [Burkholderiales bacterium]|nr:hypothetical protein [Burkholderiales bacterium]
MKHVRIDELIIDDEAGFACSKSKLVEEGLPHLRPFNVADDGGLDLTQVYLVPPNEAPKGKAQLVAGDILFNNTNSTDLVGKSAVVNEPMVAGFSNHLTRVRVDRNRVDPLWFGFWLRRLRSTGYFAVNATQWVSQAAYRTADLRKLELGLPSLDEQRRIVDMLSRAEGIVRLRREAQKKAAEIIPALFLDMFGDPATNPKGWAEPQLGTIVDEFRYGTSRKSGDSGLPTLRIPNVIGDKLDPTEMKLVGVPDAEVNRLRLRDGDFLFVRTNGNPDYVGRSAVYESDVIRRAGFDGDNCLYASYLIRARLKLEVVNPRFLQSFLSSAEGRKRLREQARTSAGQYNINTEGLASIRIPLPPIQIQADFEDRCRPLFGLQELQSSALSKAEATFHALLAWGFSSSDSAAREAVAVPSEANAGSR